MKIIHFSQQGKRGNNEDSLGISGGLLTVCDGMGGHNYGERASAFVQEAMIQAFADPKPLGKMEIQQQLNKVQVDLNKLLETEPELEKMGTTFTGVFITPDVWYAAHIGDSRIYLFRPSEQKLWHTWDHSIVGELMRTHEITVEAGRFHPLSNRISRAIIAQKDGKPANASIAKIEELKKGDILLLCSDGVVEGWGDLELVKLFSDNSLSFEQKCEKLRAQCEAKSKDNNTAIIIEIEEKDAFNYSSDETLEWTAFDEVEADYQKYLKGNAEPEKVESEKTESEEPEEAATPKSPKGGFNWRKVLPLLLVFIALVIIGVIFLTKGKSSTEEDKKTQTMIEQQIKDSIYNAKMDNLAKEKEEARRKKEQQHHNQQIQKPQREEEKPNVEETHPAKQPEEPSMTQTPNTQEVHQEPSNPESQPSTSPEKKKMSETQSHNVNQALGGKPK